LFPEENPSPILRVFRDGTLLYANRAAEPMLENWRADCGKDVPNQLSHCIESSFRSEIPGECEVNAMGRTISFVVVPLPDRDYVNLYGRDITARKWAEEEIVRAKEEWERTFASVPDLITILDNEHRVLRVNEAMARRLGLKPEECVGLHCYEAVHGTSGPPAFCPHLRTIVDGCEHVEELHVDRLGGDFLVTTTPLLDAQGERIGSVHIAHDITERKRMEDALREREHRYRELVQNANSAIIRWKRDGTIVFFNEFAQKFFGYDLEEVLGKKVAILLPQSESTGADLSGLLHDIVEHPERFVNNVNENVLRDGRRVWMAWTNRPILDEQGRVAEILAVGIDITERKLAEDALHSSYEELERFNRATVGRELRMVDLKKEVNELCGRAGEKPRYKLDFVEEPEGE
jgi:PAS domain S-box-containing protein